METQAQLKIKTQKQFEEILTPDLLDFLTALHQNFNDKRLELLKERKKTQQEFDKGILPKFLYETEEIRNGNWTCASLPEDLLDRRVEITGPVDRKMIINALNSGAHTFMADFEDSSSPTWENCIEGQINLSDAVSRKIDFTNENGKAYKLNEKTAVLLVRPRGLHLPEKHIEINGEEASGSLTDFGIYFFRNVKNLLEKGSGPYFYLPKLEHYKEARWWNDVFVFAQNYLEIPQGTIKATVLIETITASFQIDEILYELKEHSAGLNCGRWDYIFSYIKKLRNLPEFIVPDRDQVTMTSPFMSAYSKRVIEICHKRNVHAIGGMAAQIPVKDDDEANRIAFEKVRSDKEREVKNGHDGTWVAHPALVTVAKEIFDQYMPEKNQIDKKFEYHIKETDLLEIPKGEITEKGVRKNINVGILYLESWLMGTGAAAIYNLMEDAATAEISRTQIWQWLKNEAVLSGDRTLTRSMVLQWETEEMENIENYVGENRFKTGKFNLAKELFNELIFSENFEEFLTLKAYPFI
ncbi:MULTISPECIES: malate synthase A [Chryseobacterium]|uniref:Malate synthase n=1 Tax=Chryseobacterium rhizosphaerae TaxID=395937 RepID=A0AAE4C2H4_9FLAO|nr:MULTISPECIES: malate synthase A [Chryseobacterium]MBL3548147.1 malate synthase A [Chryseobacterium sp. KMC2]MDR6527521.1 malate synthase [Chryseobacterium rhizosphaerae]MDR6547572.1 malate synthase [Chryseobacterium rhizosphaerae]REC76672.1 malate synthase A [Chryseobacterium rhizosphaerae]GEN66884.1 malate synthase [Chryseobacterium rhizosphaerae]